VGVNEIGKLPTVVSDPSAARATEVTVSVQVTTVGSQPVAAWSLYDQVSPAARGKNADCAWGVGVGVLVAVLVD
jgi:hypothetical protein